MDTTRDTLKKNVKFRMLDQLKYLSTCRRGHTAAMILRDGRIVSIGYNGAPPGMPHCTPKTCNEEARCTASVHAEANAIAFAARQGISTDGSVMYCISSPCLECAKLIVSAGIKVVFYKVPYHAEAGRHWFLDGGVELIAHE